jgi:hypothetical protein
MPPEAILPVRNVLEKHGFTAAERRYMKNHGLRALALYFVIVSITIARATAADDSDRPFVHPGGLHSKADLERVRLHVANGDHPWIDSWNALIKDPKAQLNYKPAPQANMGTSRQRASADAVAAYLNAVRGYVSGDTAYTDNAIQICNLWSAAVNQVPHGVDQPGLNGIYTYEFAVVGETLRIYVGTRWTQPDFDRFKRMMRTYLYPSCHDFLVHHDDSCISHFWANWDACCITAVGATSVLCDDRTLFNEAVEYFKNGSGNGSIKNAVYFIHDGNFGQWQESGRDQEHAELGIGLLASFCQIAQNQGLDLFGYENNRLLAGAEYTAKYTLWQPVPYKFYNNCDDVNQYWISPAARGRLQRPIWDQLYNEYVVRRGLKAPYLTAIAALNRPEGYTHDDHFGYGTLMYTLNASDYPPLPIPTGPTGLTATSGVGRVYVQWSPPVTANGFTIRRATTHGGPYTELTTYRGIIPEYTDMSVTNSTTYYYVVAADNQAGTSPNSAEANATPQPADAQLPAAWSQRDIGKVHAPGSAKYATVGNNTFIVRGAGSNIDNTRDGIAFAFTSVTGDATFTARLIAGEIRNQGPNSRLGILIRSSLDPDAPTVALVLGDLGYREVRFGTRKTPGAAMSFVPGNAYSGLGQAPSWFRLTRTQDNFTAFQSNDGDHWYEVGSSTVKMDHNIFCGIAVASDSPSSISATFDHVAVTPSEK